MNNKGVTKKVGKPRSKRSLTEKERRFFELLLERADLGVKENRAEVYKIIYPNASHATCVVEASKFFKKLGECGLGEKINEAYEKKINELRRKIFEGVDATRATIITDKHGNVRHIKETPDYIAQLGHKRLAVRIAGLDLEKDGKLSDLDKRTQQTFAEAIGEQTRAELASASEPEKIEAPGETKKNGGNGRRRLKPPND